MSCWSSCEMRVPGAARHQHAAGQVADAQVHHVARLRRPLERQRRRRQPDEAVDLVVVVGARRRPRAAAARCGSSSPASCVRSTSSRSHSHESHACRRSAIVRTGVREKSTEKPMPAVADVDVAGLGELGVERRLEPADDVVRLVAVAELGRPCRQRASTAPAAGRACRPRGCRRADRAARARATAARRRRCRRGTSLTCTLSCVAAATSRLNALSSRAQPVPSGATDARRSVTGSARAGKDATQGSDASNDESERAHQ